MTVKTTRVKPKHVRLGDRVLCGDYMARVVDVIDKRHDGWRFSFTDGKWLHTDIGSKVTVVSTE